MRFALCLGAVAAGLLALPLAPAAAEETKISGTIRYSPPETEEAELGGTTVVHVRTPGIVQGDAAGMVAEENHLCFGTMRLNSDGAMDYGTGYCVQTDPDGDIWWLTWTGALDATEWKMAGGTGKYENLSGEGTTTLVSDHDDGSWTVRYEGTMVTE